MRSRRRNRKFHQGHRAVLLFGTDYFGDFRNADLTDDELRQAWDALRDDVIELWQSRKRTDDFPWGYRRFELGTAEPYRSRPQP